MNIAKLLRTPILKNICEKLLLKFAKDFMGTRFSELHSKQIELRLENGEELYDIEVDFRLTVLQPFNGK